MALVKCANCGKDISDKAEACIYCGTTDFLGNNSNVKKEEIEEIKKEIVNDTKDNEVIIKEESSLKTTEEIEKIKDEIISNTKDEIAKIKDDLMANEKKEKERIKELEQELEKSRNENLKKDLKLEKLKKEKIKVQIDWLKYLTIVINIIRYLMAIILALGCLSSLISRQFLMGLGYLIFAITFCPFIYKMIWKDKEVSKGMKIVCQIIALIIGFIIFGILISGGAQ